MTVQLSEIKTQANALLREDDRLVLTDDNIDRHISSAVREYSKRRPYRIVYEETGVSNGQYALPSDFEEGFSRIEEIEYPINEAPKCVIDPKWYDIESVPSGRVIRFRYYNPTNGEMFWIKYTKRQWYDTDGGTTIPESDLDGIVNLSVSIMCEALANYYATKANVNLTEAEPFQYDTRVAEYNSRANKHREKYDMLIRPDVSGVTGHVDFSDQMFFDRNAE